MAPKKKFTKERVVEAAFEIARTEGLGHITIRKVADKLGGSIAPIYVNFADIDELKQAVIRQIHELSRQMLQTPYCPDPFLNIGIASLKFARTYPVLFRDLLMNSRKYIGDVNPPVDRLLEQMRQDSQLEGLPNEALMEILLKMQVFQTGLSVMDVFGLLPKEFDEGQLISLLESAGGDIIAAVRKRNDEE